VICFIDFPPHENAFVRTQRSDVRFGSESVAAMLVFTSVSFGGSGFQHVFISFTYPILLNLARGFSNSRIVLPKMPRRFVLTKFILRTPTTNDRTRGTPKLSRQR
jgi:hypothetical protein